MTLDEIITKCNIGEDHLTQEEYEQVGRWLEELKHLKISYEELAKAFEATEHCCPYDNKKCSKTGCYVVGGTCARRSKKAREELNEIL